MAITTTVIAVANNKGGVAKTTTACNLADGLARKLRSADGKPTGAVLLVDLDPQGNDADFFGVRQAVYDPERNRDGRCISFLLSGQASLKESIISLDRSKEDLPRPNLYLLPASKRLEDTAEDLVALDAVAARRPARDHVPLGDILSHRLAGAVGVFRYIIIDCPPKLDVFKVAVYRFADRVIVPTKADMLSVVGAVQHTEDLDMLRREMGVKAQIAYVLPAMILKNQIMDRDMVKALLDTYGRNRIAAPVPQAVVVKESPGVGGRSLFEYAPDSPAAAAYQNLVDKVWAGV